MEDQIFSLEARVMLYKDSLLHARQDHPEFSESELDEFIQQKTFVLDLLQRTIESWKNHLERVMSISSS